VEGAGVHVVSSSVSIAEAEAEFAKPVEPEAISPSPAITASFSLAAICAAFLAAA